MKGQSSKTLSKSEIESVLEGKSHKKQYEKRADWLMLFSTLALMAFNSDAVYYYLLNPYGIFITFCVTYTYRGALRWIALKFAESSDKIDAEIKLKQLDI